MHLTVLITTSIFIVTSLHISSTNTKIMAFLFGSATDEDRCDRVELEQCFETAFKTMRIGRNARRARNRTSSASHSGATRHRRSIRSRNRVLLPKGQHLCAANRPYLSCFSNEGCREEYTAHVASTAFKRIHGRFFPIQMFLAHKGYALQLCSQICSRESRKQCQKLLNAEQQHEEHENYLSLVTMSKELSLSTSSSKDRSLCQHFKKALRKLIQYRSRFCGEVAKCVCIDVNVQEGILYCKVGCENILDENVSIKPRSYTVSSKAHVVPLSNFIILLILLRFS